MQSPLLSELLEIGSVLLLIAINAFFVATEFALVSVRRTRIEELVRVGNQSRTLDPESHPKPRSFDRRHSAGYHDGRPCAGLGGRARALGPSPPNCQALPRRDLRPGFSRSLCGPGLRPGDIP